MEYNADYTMSWIAAYDLGKRHGCPMPSDVHGTLERLADATRYPGALAAFLVAYSEGAADREPKVQLCEWFALCDHPATGTMPHPILGQVPICDRCRQRVEDIEDGDYDSDSDQDHCESCGAPDDGTQSYCDECGEPLIDPKYISEDVKASKRKTSETYEPDSRKREELTDDVLRILTDPLFDSQFGGHFTCGEAETVAEWMRAYGYDEGAAIFMEEHAESDDDPSDLHYREGR